MPQKYNIVLIPSLETHQKFIQFAKECFGKIYNGYLLGENSIPHISLCQFEGTKEQLQQIIEGLKGLRYSSYYSPTLYSLNTVQLGGSFTGKYAADLGVDRTPEIMQLHYRTTEVVKKIGLEPLNAKDDRYRPHLTLAFFDPQAALTILNPEKLFGNNVPFTVAVGIADENWQFTEVLSKQTDLSIPSSSSLLINDFGYTQEQVEAFLDIAKKMTVGLDGFLTGTIFKGNYSKDEQMDICDELVRIVNKEFAGKNTASGKLYVTTAGAPGTGKSFFIEHKYHISSGSNTINAVYVDPDRAVLLPELKMYLQYLKDGKDIEVAYAKWRDASNYIANFMLIKAVYENLSIIHGTTASSERVINIYNYLKQIGYRIEIDLLFAQEEDRISSLNHREEISGRVQITKEDMKGKVAPIFFRMKDCYLKYADQISMFYQFSRFWENGQIKHFAEYNKTGPGIVQLLPDSEIFIRDLISEIDHELKGQDIVDQLKEDISKWKPLVKPQSGEALLVQYLAPSAILTISDEKQPTTEHEKLPSPKIKLLA